MIFFISDIYIMHFCFNFSKILSNLFVCFSHFY